MDEYINNKDIIVPNYTLVVGIFVTNDVSRARVMVVS
jgi:hypothetical protein